MTQQPSGAAPEGGYAQPQDPWGSYEPGVASVPTDPIPQQYDPYASAGQGQVWSQQTEVQGGQYEYVPAQLPPRRTGPVILVAVLVLAVAGAAGYVAYRFALPSAPTGDGQTPSPSAASTTAPATKAAFDPHLAKKGDCVFNYGTPTKPELDYVDCSTEHSYKIVKVAQGADIPEGPDGKFDANVTSVAVCGDTNYQTWYGYKDALVESRDVFFCMTNNP